MAHVAVFSYTHYVTLALRCFHFQIHVINSEFTAQVFKNFYENESELWFWKSKEIEDKSDVLRLEVLRFHFY